MKYLANQQLMWKYSVKVTNLMILSLIHNSEFKKILLLAALLLCGVYSFASEEDPEYVNDPIEGLFNISKIVTGDAINPKSFTEPGDFYTSATGSRFSVRTLSYKTGGEGGGHIVRSEDLSGQSEALSIDLILSENISISAVRSEIQMSGTAYSENPEDSEGCYGEFDIEKNSVNSSMVNIGYLLNSSNNFYDWRVYGGVIRQSYDSHMDYYLSESDNCGEQDYTLTANVVVNGFTVGTSISVNLFDSIRLTPYLILMHVESPEFTIQNNNTGTSVTRPLNEGLDSGNLQGLDIQLGDSDGLIFGFSFDGDYIKYSPLIDFPSEDPYNGLEMKSYSLTIGYKF